MLLWLADHMIFTVLCQALVVLLTTFAGVSLIVFGVPWRRNDSLAWRDVVAAALCVVFAVTFAVQSAYAVRSARGAAIASAVQSKYGDQVTRLGKLQADHGIHHEPVTSEWVINGKKTLCTIDAHRRQDPLVTCGTELPLAHH